MEGLKSQWSSLRIGKKPDIGGGVESREKLVIAHFMVSLMQKTANAKLGNTYPFTESDWSTTFDQAEETGLDALALNLGSEEWQQTQALSAFSVLASRPKRYVPPSGSSYAVTHPSEQKLQLFVSMDMDSLPKFSADDGDALRDSMSKLLKQDGYLRWKGRRVLSTFSGHDASFGRSGWEGWLDGLNSKLGEKVFFWPSFFLPPDTLLKMPCIDGIFNWNAAWPLTDSPSSLKEDEPILPSKTCHKSYMAAVSPLFFTHYGSTGSWAWNKNWIFPSDRLLYPTRWTQLLSLEPERQPDIIQVISWNDHGESHAIAPVLGAQPGCEAWTDGMGHEAFRGMTAYWIDRWKNGAPEGDEVKIWMWYRTHPKDLVAEGDEVGRPAKADWADDLINVMVVVPSRGKDLAVILDNGGDDIRMELVPGKANMLAIPFVPGEVEIQVVQGDTVLLAESGREIDGEIERYNFNMWSGAWTVKLD